MLESNLLKTDEHTAPESREILQTFVWWRAQSAPPPLPTYNVCKFSQLSGAIFSLANFKELLSVVSTDFP